MNQIDNYQIIEKIGEGGMGEVYKGIDVMLEREVAIKLLKPELSSKEDVVQRFRSEAVALGRLHHNNIATVYNFGRHNDQYYMALEFVDGGTLEDIINQKGLLPWREAVHYAISILEGLSHAHGFNIVHRDIKPSNIIITNNHDLKILDFGIARILEKARLTRLGHLVGTLEYVSPEQLQGKDTDERSDLYSTAVLLYEMLTGHLPFEKSTDYDLIKSQIEEKPKSLRIFAESIPPMLDKTILKALEKRPDKRFANAGEFSRELNKVLYKTVEKTRPSAVTCTENSFFRFCMDYPVLILLGVFLMGGSGYLVWNIGFLSIDESASMQEASEPPINNSMILSNSNIKDTAEPPLEQSNPELPRQIEDSRSTTNKRVIAEEPFIKAAKALTPETKSVSSNNDRNKRRVSSAHKRKKSKKTLSSDPDIDDWAKDFFKN
ncbi:MAG: serine/threonine protein kinase [Methylosarcina sp.]